LFTDSVPIADNGNSLYSLIVPQAPTVIKLASLSLITAVANLENPLDVPGFFAQLCMTLATNGIVVLIQPMGLARSSALNRMVCSRLLLDRTPADLKPTCV
jgi:hypothetical protein